MRTKVPHGDPCPLSLPDPYRIPQFLVLLLQDRILCSLAFDGSYKRSDAILRKSWCKVLWDRRIEPGRIELAGPDTGDLWVTFAELFKPGMTKRRERKRCRGCLYEDAISADRVGRFIHHVGRRRMTQE